ncbi:MAG: hypothetical protein HOG03_14185 [Desulfobacula sp.]|jgi:hypothetical protein|uniref:hypothetical protein n=1 Tax=Desulfobacula sp. TaxID=2593537 RepID=UPI001D872DB0|nr:hypothetical protein [Desulfobacula sp.]MBT3486254.1 hypothetical protein [Desulfobacula sp.]MBT3805726.1 hypothetical protein [Desulfobacula sp.]MBT4025404.1 hypothetical protein [Desulfobacula sp.]MBT4200058.1 hypothetical protein [Desulfobacula sp.]
MNHELKTLEIAKIYESQGYFEEALKIYSFLDGRKTSFEIRAGLERTTKRADDKSQGCHPEENISRLYQEWLELMVLKHRLDNFKKLSQSPV